MTLDDDDPLFALRSELSGPTLEAFEKHLQRFDERPEFVGDSYLAFAAMDGRPIALRRVHDIVEKETLMVGRRARGSTLDERDLLQRVLAKLLVASPGETLGLASYNGAGPLAAWVRVVAARELTSALRKRSEEPQSSNEELLPATGAGADPEAEFLRAKYRSIFEDAFRRAAERLTAEERNALRYHYVDRFSIDRIATIYGLHRSSVARRIQGAREALLTATREALRTQTFGSDSELESVLRAVESRVQLSVTKLFGVSAEAITPSEADQASETNEIG